jgi:DNA-binding transcriptional LysR family regulator
MFNLRSLDLNLLTVFEAIYELGTVTAAADRLALSQSATSHALSRVREACKDDLFVRVHQGLSPTPVARELYPVISKALTDLRRSLAEATGFDPATSERRFRISIPHPMGPLYALSLRAVVAGVAPGVGLTFETISRPVDLEDNLRAGIVDLAIDWLPVSLDPFVNQRLFDDRLVLLARGDHPFVNTTCTIEDLRKAEFVNLHHRRATGYMPVALQEFDKLALNEVVHVSELLEVPIIVATTDLLGLFPSSMASLVHNAIRLQVLEIPLDLPPMPIHLIWHEARRNDAAHRWLRELVAAELRRSAEG